MTDKDRLDWLEAHHTLHQSVEILYVVDGYQVCILHEDGITDLSPKFEGHDLRAAIDEAISFAAPQRTQAEIGRDIKASLTREPFDPYFNEEKAFIPRQNAASPAAAAAVEALRKIAGSKSNATTGLLLAGISVGASSDTSGNVCRQIAREALKRIDAAKSPQESK